MNQKYIYLLIICNLFIFGSCKKPNAILPTIEYKIQEIKIPINENYSNSYHTLHSYEEDGKNFFVGYNNKQHSLDFFNLDDNKAIRNLKLEGDGPNGVNEISSIFYHTKDSIFLFERGALHLMNSSGLVFDTFKLYELFDIAKYGEPGLNFYFRLIYNPASNSVLFYLNNLSKEIKADAPKIASLNIASRKVEILPISNTSFYQSNDGNVGFLSYIGFHDYFEGKILYNFQYQSSLFFYDVQTKEIKSVSGTSAKTSFISPLSFSNSAENFDKHALENTHFLSPIPDKWKRLIYRFNWESPENLEQANFTDKKQSFSVFDDNLNFIDQISLPNYTFHINNWFVNQNGLYLNKAHPMYLGFTDEYLVFDLITFEKQEK